MTILDTGTQVVVVDRVLEDVETSNGELYSWVFKLTVSP